MTIPGRVLRKFALQAAALYIALTFAVTYPQGLQLSDHLADVGDPLLNAWALAWVAHQLPFAPAHLFDANIFHPEADTLAYSESLIAPALIGAPLLWLGAGPIVVYNLLFFAAFVGSGVGTALLVFELTGRRSAALVAGAAFAFLPYKIDHYSHFQLLQTQWIPLALWALHRWLNRPSLLAAVGLGASVGAQALTSMYNALFLGVFLTVVGAVALAARRLSTRHLPSLVLAAVVAGTMALPVVVAHVRAREVVGERTKGEAVGYSAQWSDFLASVPTSRFHGGWSRPFGAPERRLFPGFTALALAIVALWPPLSWPRVAYAVAALVCADMALGFNGFSYPVVYDYLSPFKSLRVPARMGLMVGFALAVLAGFGLSRLCATASKRMSALAATFALAGILTDVWVAPFGLIPVPTDAPLIYFDMLRDKGQTPRITAARLPSDPSPAVLLELPINRDAPTYMYYSTFHWQTLVNGYSGFFSDRYTRLTQRLDQFPNDDAISALAALGVRYIMIHGELMNARDHARLLSALDTMAPTFRIVNRRPWKDSEISLYRFTPR